MTTFVGQAPDTDDIPPPPEPPPDPEPGGRPTPTAEYSGDGSGLNAFLNDHSGGSEIVGLEVDAEYDLGTDGVIDIEGGSVSVVGRGGVILRPNRGTVPIVTLEAGFHDASWYDLTVQGSKPEDALWDVAKEHEHGFAFGGAQGLLFDGVQVRNVGGDGLYFGGSTFVDRWAEAIRFTNGAFHEIGRMCVALTDGALNVVVDFCAIDTVCYHLAVFEPNGYFIDGAAAGAVNFRFSDNEITGKAYGDHVADPTQAAGYALVATGASLDGPYTGDQPFKSIVFARNLFHDVPMKVGVFHNAGSNGARVAAQSVQVIDNVSEADFVDDADFDECMSFDHVDTLTVTGNTQPLAGAATFLTTSSCTGAIITSPNTTP